MPFNLDVQIIVSVHAYTARQSGIANRHPGGKEYNGERQKHF